MKVRSSLKNLKTRDRNNKLIKEKVAYTLLIKETQE